MQQKQHSSHSTQQEAPKYKYKQLLQTKIIEMFKNSLKILYAEDKKTIYYHSPISISLSIHSRCLEFKFWQYNFRDISFTYSNMIKSSIYLLLLDNLYRFGIIQMHVCNKFYFIQQQSEMRASISKNFNPHYPMIAEVFIIFSLFCMLSVKCNNIMEPENKNMTSPTQPQGMVTSRPDNKSLQVVYTIMDYGLMLLYLLTKAMISPITFILNFCIGVFQFFLKIVKLGLTFIMNGIQGVQKTLKIGTFAERIHYAILKQNGQYLKLANRTLQEIFTCQLYDYGIRSTSLIYFIEFMSISQLEEDTKLTEIQVWSTVGLNFIKQKFNIKNVAALTNSRERINRFRNKMKQIELLCTDYSGDTPAPQQDIFVFFNRSREHEEHKLQIDMIKVLGYIKKNLTEHGYAVLGNYFNCEGDMAVFEEILEGFGFKIQMKEDITPNIIHSRRVLGRIHKNRKVAWLVGKLKQFIVLAFEHDNIVSNTLRNIWRILQQMSGIKTNECKYNLYILQHAS